jgi:hypothetical protein
VPRAGSSHSCDVEDDLVRGELGPSLGGAAAPAPRTLLQLAEVLPSVGEYNEWRGRGGAIIRESGINEASGSLGTFRCAIGSQGD